MMSRIEPASPVRHENSPELEAALVVSWLKTRNMMKQDGILAALRALFPVFRTRLLLVPGWKLSLTNPFQERQK